MFDRYQAFQEATIDLENAERLDAVVGVGDIAENGLAEEYQLVYDGLKGIEGCRYISATGNHDIRLRAYSQSTERFYQFIDNLNDDYMSILKLTGNDPDVNRDYGLSRIMPDVIVNLGGQAIALESAVDYISEMNGIKSDNTATLEQAAVLVERMATDEAEIAANLGSLKEWISSLGTWMTNVSWKTC